MTAGNVLFSCRRDGVLLAHNATTGEVLWEGQVSEAPASPITYELDGRQYVTVLTGPAAGMPTMAGRVYTFVLKDDRPLPESGRDLVWRRPSERVAK